MAPHRKLSLILLITVLALFALGNVFINPSAYGLCDEDDLIRTELYGYPVLIDQCGAQYEAFYHEGLWLATIPMAVLFLFLSLAPALVFRHWQKYGPWLIATSVVIVLLTPSYPTGELYTLFDQEQISWLLFGGTAVLSIVTGLYNWIRLSQNRII